MKNFIKRPSPFFSEGLVFSERLNFKWFFGIPRTFCSFLRRFFASSMVSPSLVR